ncbi:hypothetical protein DPEC_G00233410 [Dallia pectoralis]|uniref:Uncharacterized protein n=1 Tax=Dallia pectoralis TaxID=75939 RepID=A0ACC2FXD4_DALPE|nr:hypothetical protein DPEC_G00233410 [Dallia pectoralis]
MREQEISSRHRGEEHGAKRRLPETKVLLRSPAPHNTPSHVSVPTTPLSSIFVRSVRKKRGEKRAGTRKERGERELVRSPGGLAAEPDAEPPRRGFAAMQGPFRKTPLSLRHRNTYVFAQSDATTWEGNRDNASEYFAVDVLL